MLSKKARVLFGPFTLVECQLKILLKKRMRPLTFLSIGSHMPLVRVLIIELCDNNCEDLSVLSYTLCPRIRMTASAGAYFPIQILSFLMCPGL